MLPEPSERHPTRGLIGNIQAQERPLGHRLPTQRSDLAERVAPPEPLGLLPRGNWGQSPFLRLGVTPYLVAADTVSGLSGFAVGWHPGQLLALVAMVAVLARSGLYRSRLKLSLLDDLPRLTSGVLVGGLVIAGSPVLLAASAPAPGDVALRVSVMLATLLITRALAYRFVRWARRSGRVAHRALLIGAGQVGLRLARSLQSRPEFGIRPVGFLESQPGESLLLDELPIPVLGDCSDLSRRVQSLGVSQIFVAFGRQPESEMVDLLRTCHRLKCEIFLVPRLYELHPVTAEIDEVHGIPLLRMRRPAHRSQSWRLKRMFDVVVSVVLLVLFSPILIACATAVYFEGGAGVLFRQDRVGLDGRRFRIIKFRSLAPASEDESRTTWNVRHDVRIGRVGRFLRRTSLDELPQLWNVLVGDMSLVGPRPERPHFVDQFTPRIPRYGGRHRVPAGVTGWAQVHGLRGDTSIEERALFDNHYIENWSLWLDVKILVRTLEQVVRRRGA